ncbi:MAG: homoaconitase [Planctomycetota bacterium]|nr:MAG: homoaconitase [Planctomycetota bacterium]
MGLTLVEKIATRYTEGLKPGEQARQGMIVRIRPRHVMTHDNTGAVIPKFESIFEGTGITPRVADPPQPVFAIDHDIQNHSPENLAKYARIAAFAERHSIDYYPPGTGISHQVMVEQGYAIPGALIVGSDSHSNLYGGVSALGTPIVRTDAACLWATGTTWWQVPLVARCRLTGRLREGVVGKDVIIALCGLFNNDEVLNHAVEFVGDGIEHLSMDQRLSIANMTTEWGALAGVFPFDHVLHSYLLARADYLTSARRPGERRAPSRGSYTRQDVERWWNERLVADDDANYAVELELDLSTVVPHVSGPNHVKTMVSVPEMETRRVKIDKAYLVSCVNARLEDIESAAEVLKDRHVAEGVEMYVGAASEEVQRQAEASGAWDALVSAGAITLPPGCGPCIGLGRGLVEDGEVAISATNRNFKGRMGSRNAEVYLASPAVVAASAAAGYICAPERYESLVPSGSARRLPRPGTGKKAQIVPGFPERLTGRALLLPVDNMNTDGIYAGKWTYKDDMTPEEMAKVVFENYDPNFAHVARPGDIIVSGSNFGTGSSREQAATALKYRGIACVIAASFSETYKRNAFNNGYLCIECAELYEYLKAALVSEGSAATIVGPVVDVSFESGCITVDGQSFSFDAPSEVAQELVVSGGAEAAARTQLSTHL